MSEGDRTRSRGLPPRRFTGGEADEGRRVERVLASARASLAACCLVAIYLDPTEPSRHASAAYGLLSAYVVHSSLALLWISRMPLSGPGRIALHGADVLWAAVLSLFTEGPNSPFFMFFTFVLLAAAYRWGFRETLATAAAGTAILVIEAILVVGPLPPGAPWNLEGQFELNRFIMRCVYLMIGGYLLGRIAEAERTARRETSRIAQMLIRARSARGLRQCLEVIFEEGLGQLGAPEAALVTLESASRRVYQFEGHRERGSHTRVEPSELSASRAPTLLFDAPADAWSARRDGGETVVVRCLDGLGGGVALMLDISG